MAGYRPKSLNELNDMYDKTITAEKAIIKASKQLHEEAEKIVPAQIPAEEPSKEQPKAVEELSDEVDSLINRFKSETLASQVKRETAPVPKETTPAVEPPKKISYEKDTTAEVQAVKPSQPKMSAPAPVKSKSLYTLETPDELIEKAAAKSDERTELFDDYMKIMNDEDDDFFSKRESFKKKDKKKKHKKGFFFRHEPKEDEFTEEFSEEEKHEKEISDLAEPESYTQPQQEEPQDSDLPVREVIYTPEIPEAFEGLNVEFNANGEDEEEEFSNFVSEADEASAETEPELEPALPQKTEDEPIIPEVSEQDFPDFDIGTEEDELPPVPSDIADTTYEEFMNDSQDIYSFDPNKANTIPEYARQQYSFDSDEAEEEYYDEDDGEAFEFQKEFEAPKNKKGIVAGRVILSIILSFLCIFAVAVIGINALLGVNTGNAVFSDKYIFTAQHDYINSDILEGDLVITEKRYANDGEVFAYINYTQQRFMFGKRNGSIVNDSGDVLFIAENDGERVLVLRDDTRGVVASTYPGVGKILSICTDNFIPIMAVVLILCLVIVLLLALVLKDKEKAYKKMMKKMIKKGVISADEEADYRYEEDSQTESEDLFSTIE